MIVILQNTLRIKSKLISLYCRDQICSETLCSRLQIYMNMYLKKKPHCSFCLIIRLSSNNLHYTHTGKNQKTWQQNQGADRPTNLCQSPLWHAVQDIWTNSSWSKKGTVHYRYQVAIAFTLELANIFKYWVSVMKINSCKHVCWVFWISSNKDICGNELVYTSTLNTIQCMKILHVHCR